MKKLYQSKWHNIEFKEFYEISKGDLPDSTFYEKFYNLFHEKYSSFSDLDKTWVKEKLQYIELFRKSSKFRKDSKILSIGCGLGLIEKELMQRHGFDNIEVTEITESPLNWIKQYIPPSNIHIGYFPDCIKHDKKYDLIILSVIDYVFTDNEFIEFSKEVNKRLGENGECILMSASHLKVDLLYRAKKSIQNILAYVDTKSQFYGYSRRSKELITLMNFGGFKFIDGDRNDKNLAGVYWSIFKK